MVKKGGPKNQRLVRHEYTIKDILEVSDAPTNDVNPTTIAINSKRDAEMIALSRRVEKIRQQKEKDNLTKKGVNTMNIIEAFKAINLGEAVVDPEGGIWEKAGVCYYSVKWPDGSEWTNEWDVPARLILGEWSRKTLEDNEVLPALRRGCVLKGEHWSLAQIRLNLTNEHLEYRCNPNEDWISWVNAQSFMARKWVIVDDPEGKKHKY